MSASRETYHHGDLRAALIAETEAMIAAGQLDSVTLQELGRRLGVARSAPYRHFPSKNALLCAVATRAFERLRDRDRAARLAPGLSARERLKLMGRSYVELAIADRDEYRLMFREGLVGENETPELKAVREEDFLEAVLLFEECQAQRSIAQGDIESQIVYCWATLHGLASFAIDGHLPNEMVLGMLDWTLETLLKGLRPDPQTP